MIIKGRAQIKGKNTGHIVVVQSKEELLKYKGKYVDYKLEIIEESEQQKKARTHKVKYMAFNPNLRQHLFKVTSGESGEEYLVDVTTGCGCKHGGAKGVAKGKMCSHIRQVLKKMVM